MSLKSAPFRCGRRMGVPAIERQWGGSETNPALRGVDGRFGARGGAIKFGLLGGALVIEYWFHRRHPNSDTAVMIFNASMTAESTGAAIHNVGFRRTP